MSALQPVPSPGGPERHEGPAADAALYDQAYYEKYGPRDETGALLSPPYRRGVAHWEQFFGAMADRIIEQLAPASALDAGCAIGFLTEELRRRGVDAHGIDISEWAIEQVPEELRPYCRVASLTDELPDHYDLITCLEVLEHLTPQDAMATAANLCRHTDAILFSSTPDDVTEPTHINVQPSDYWIGMFARNGFYRDLRYDASYVAPHAVLLRRRPWTAPEVAEEYERAWWQQYAMSAGARETRDRLSEELSAESSLLAGERERVAVLRAQAAELDDKLVAASTYVNDVAAECDEKLAVFRSNRDEAVSRLNLALAALEAERDAAALSMAEAARSVETAQRTLAERDGELRALRDELQAIHQTRTFRYTALLRRVYGRARRRRAAAAPSSSTSAVSTPTDDPPHATYAEWVERYDQVDDGLRQQLRRRLSGLAARPLVSVVMPVHDPPEPFLRAAIESVLGQLYEHVELCIADDASEEGWVPRVLAEYAARDPRVAVVRRPRNGHISEATNSALELAHGEWIAFLDHDDELSELAVALTVLALAARPDPGLAYSDEDKIDPIGERSGPYFKPDWDPLLFLGQNYLTHFSVIRKDLVDQVGGCRTGFEGAQDWDLTLRVTERLRDDQIVHVPHVLYHWRTHPQSTAYHQGAKPYAGLAARRALAEHVERTGRTATVSPVGRTGFQRVRWDLPPDPPLVSIVIPTKGSTHLIGCIESLRSRTTYPAYEVCLIDNGTTDPVVLAYLADNADWLRITRDARPFNFSALNNRAVAQTRGEVVCLMNDDVEIVSPGWLDELVGQLLQPGVGVVGAKLYFPDGRLQHTGVVLGVGGVAAHGFRLQDRNFLGHFGHAALARTPSAVTAACMVVRKEVWEKVDGLDEMLAVSYNDVDFCLRVAQAGWRVAWTPWAELIHHESVTRGQDTDPANVERAESELRWMMQRWAGVLARDPGYNPNLTLDREDYSLSWPPRADRAQLGGGPPSRVTASG